MDLQAPFARMEAELEELSQRLSDPVVINDQNLFRDLAKRHSELGPAIDLWHEYQQSLSDTADAEGMMAEAEDDEMKDFMRLELEEAQGRVEKLHGRLLRELLPKDPMSDHNAIIEIRSGTGGEEASLFAGDLYGMYAGLAERRGWKIEIVDENESDLGGYSKINMVVEGRGAYGTMKHEIGVHRVQRVPKTESQGRIHTSTASVVVLPEIEAVDVEVRDEDLRIEAFRAGGPGGQHMQKNETAVRITHIPSGIAVASSNQRSQMQNKEQAMRMLRSRIYEAEMERRAAAESALRKDQIKTGDRSEKIRTYNWPQDRVTDHRIGMTIHNIPGIMTGDFENLLNALQEDEDAQRLAALADR